MTLAIFDQSATPDEAQRDWDSFLKAYETHFPQSFDPNLPYAKPLFVLFGNSSFLTRFLINNPLTVNTVLRSPFLRLPKPPEAFEKEALELLTTHGDFDENFKALRFYKYQEYLRITLKDLNGAPQNEVWAELSHLALAILRIATELCYQRTKERLGPPLLRGKECAFQILAMGKLGGLEVNYSSDLDLIGFIQEDDLENDPTPKEFYSKVFQLFTQKLTEKTELGFLYRIDWDLRPEGRAGPLVNTLAAMEDYYERFGADWERQALIKALPSAGSKELGDEFLRRISPFVYRKHIGFDNIKAIQEMKLKILENLSQKKGKGFNVKLGLGGIREIEFFVQSFILLFGGRDPTLRSRNTLQTLHLLREKKYISAQECVVLERSYIFLRKLEHRLQLANEEQTHTLVESFDAHLRAARRMGYHQPPEKAVEELQADLAYHTKNVHEIFVNFFELPTEDSVPKTIHRRDSERLEGLRAELRQRIEAEETYEHKLNAIRLFKKNRIKELEESEQERQVSRKETLFSLSLMAEAICQEALELARAQLSDRFGQPTYLASNLSQETSSLIILAMGKMGGYEINYASDLDVIFIYSEDGETSGPTVISNSEYFAKLVQKFISILSVPTGAGTAYAIDVELRPSGHSGTLVTSLESFMTYQREVSQIWERQALLRARPFVGAPAFGKVVQSHIKALLYSAPFSPSIKSEMHRLRMRVENELAKEKNGYFDYKLGLGGIMDIEFILQYHQLIHGANHPKLQVTNTFDGLDALIELNLLKDPTHPLLLKEAYTFYRTIESYVCLIQKRGIHRLPKGGELMVKVSQKLDFPNSNVFWEQYEVYSHKVREIYLSLLGST